MPEELFLIAHKVRGEPAFDVAVQMHIAGEPAWIVATSGHRAYPIMHWELKTLCHYIPEHEWQPSVIDELGPVECHKDWPSLRDHYAVSEARATPAQPASKISSLDLADLGL